MLRVPRIVLVVASVLALAPLAGAADGPTVIHYLASTSDPVGGWGAHCVHLPSLPLTGGRILLGSFGEIDDPPVWSPEVYQGGACVVVPAGTHTLSVVDDLGASPGYWVALRTPQNGGCAIPMERAQGTITLTVPEGCNLLDVNVLAGDVAGTIRIE